MYVLTETMYKLQTSAVFTQVHPTPHIPEQSAGERDPTWTSKYLKMEPIVMSKNAKLLIGQICKLEHMLHVMQCISFIKIPPHNDGFSLFYILLGGGGWSGFYFQISGL